MKNITNLSALVDAFSKMEHLEWANNTPLNQFLQKFEEKVRKVKENGGILPDQYVALRLLKSTNLDKLQNHLEHLNIEELSYSEVKKLVLKVYCNPTNHSSEALEIHNNTNSPSSSRGWLGKDSHSTGKIMGESTDTKHLPLHDNNFNKTFYVYPSKTYVKPPPNNNASEIVQSPNETDSASKNDPASINTLRRINPANQNGVLSKCVICRSVRHWSMDCPNQKVQKVGINYEHLETIQKNPLASDHAAVVSAGVSKSVCGSSWIHSYLKTLSPQMSAEVIHHQASNQFHINGLGEISSSLEITIPLSYERKIRVCVVDIDIPLLISRSAFIQADTKVDSSSATIIMGGELIYCNINDDGLMYFLLSADYSSDDSNDDNTTGDFSDDDDTTDDTIYSTKTRSNSWCKWDMLGGNYSYSTLAPGLGKLHNTWNHPASHETVYYEYDIQYGRPDLFMRHEYPYPIRL